MRGMQNGFKKYDVVLVDFGKAEFAGEQGGVRPAVIMSNNTGNIYSPATVVMPFTTQNRKLSQPTHAAFREDQNTGLTKESVILGECLRNVSEHRIIRKLGSITQKEDVDKIEKVKNAVFGD